MGAITSGTSSEDAAALVELARSANSEIRFPVDGHVIGEPVVVVGIRDPALPRVGLLATCRHGDRMYELSASDVTFPVGTAGASFVARYRAWLGLAPPEAWVEGGRAHEVEVQDIVEGVPVDLVVVACKSNALRCRLLGSAREVTLRTAVRYEIPGSIITVTPRKKWTHVRHPYISGDVASVRIDAAALGVAPLGLHREEDLSSESPEGSRDGMTSRQVYRLVPLPSPTDATGRDLLLEAEECIDARAYGEADELLAKALSLDLRHLQAHAMLGERHMSGLLETALHHFALGVALGSLSVDEAFDGVLPWSLLDNRPFLRCLHGLGRVLWRLDRREEAAAASRRLLHLDPADRLGASETLVALEAGKAWRVWAAGRREPDELP